MRVLSKLFVPGRLAWLPLPIAAGLLAALWVADLHVVWVHPLLAACIRLGFAGLGVAFIVWPSAQSFLATGQFSPLMLGAGTLVMALGAGACVVGFAQNASAGYAIYNTAVLLAALCHWAGVAGLARPQLQHRARWLTAVYAGGAMVLELVIWAALTGRYPVFFIDGLGGTWVRSLVMGAAALLFLWTATRLWQAHRATPTPFLQWYALGLGLLTTGLVGGMAIVVRDSPLQWAGILTQCAGLLYMAVAVRTTVRASGIKINPLAAVEDAWFTPNFFTRFRQPSPLRWVLRYGFALGTVLAAFELRVLFTARLGAGLPPYITFWPAVMAVALLAGFGPGVVATAVADLVVDYWILPPVGQFYIATAADRLGLVLFTAMSLATCIFAELYRSYRRKAAVYDGEALARASQERLATFTAAIFDGLVETEGGRIVDCNPQFARKVGYTVAELRGMELVKLVAAENRDRIQAAIREGRELVTDNDLLHKNGSRISVAAHGRPVAPGSARRLTAFRDITARKQAEAALTDFNDELQAQQVELRQAQAAALNLMDDALAARDQAAEAASALFASEQRIQQALQVSRSFTFEWFPATDEVRRSASCAAILGLPDDVATSDTGRTYFARIHPDDRARFTGMLASLTPAASTYTTDYRLVRADGSVVVLEETAQASFDLAGGLDRLVGVATDITARKQAEEQLRQNEALLRAILNQLPSGVTVRDARTGALILSNPQAQQLLGPLVGSTADYTSYHAFHPDGRPLANADWPLSRSAATGEIVKDEEILHQPAGGAVVTLRTSSAPIRDSAQQIIAAVAVFDEVTAHKQAEAQMRLQTTALQTAANAIAIAGPTGTLQWVNDAFTRLTGYSAAEAIGQNPRVLKSGQHPAEFYTGMWATITAGRVWHGELINKRKDGSLYSEEMTITPVRPGAGPITHFIAIKQDITDRKRNEEQIAASLAEKEVLLKEIHHRVKNNLQVISSLVSLQEDGLKDDRLRLVFGDVRDRVRTMALVHEQLYQSSNLAQLDFADYAGKLLRYLWRAHSTAAAQLQLKLVVAPVLVLPDTAVPCGLILTELVTNSLKHGFPGGRRGEIAVALEHDPATDVVCLRVADNGVGLPAGLDWRNAESLGLQLVQMLASQLRGTVATGPGPGTEFRVTFAINGKPV